MASPAQAVGAAPDPNRARKINGAIMEMLTSRATIKRTTAPMKKVPLAREMMMALALPRTENTRRITAPSARNIIMALARRDHNDH